MTDIWNKYADSAARTHGKPGRTQRPKSVTIDMHAHVTPERYKRAIRERGEWHGLDHVAGELGLGGFDKGIDERIAELDALGIDKQLITPTVGETAIEIGRWQGGALRTLLGMSRTYCFTPIWNHTGQPVAAIPAGFSPSGLPRSVSLIGRPSSEPTLISLAAQIEAERPWADRRPALS